MAERFSSYLGEGERLVWAGRSVPGKLLTAGDFVLIPLGVASGVLSVQCAALALQQVQAGESAVLPFLASLVIMAVCLHVLVLRLLYKLWRRNRTRYAVTNRRVLISNPWQLHSLALESMPVPSVTVDPETGVGSVWFRELPWYGRLFSNCGLEPPGANGKRPCPAFWDIAHAYDIYILIRRLRKEELGAHGRY